MSNPDNDICNGLSKLQLESNGENKANMKQFAQKCRELFEQDEDGDIQLHLAIASSHCDVADTLIRLCPQPAFLSTQNRQSYSPLHIAVLQNNPAIVRALIVNGASLSSYDRDGNTPLHLAAVRGYLECGEALLKPISVQEMSNRFSQWILANHKPEEVVDRCNYYGEQCVHLAAMGGHCKFLQFLCWNNADMNAQEGRGGRTPLHFAVGAKSLEAAHCLVEPKPFGCGVDPNLRDWCNKSAIQMAKVNHSSHIVTYLSAHVVVVATGEGEDDDLTYFSDGFESETESGFDGLMVQSRT